MSFPTSDENFSEENAYVPEVSAGRVASAAWDIGIGDRETSVLAKMKARDDLSQIGPKVKPAEINAQYPGLNADRDMTLQEAQFTFDLKQEKEESEKILQAASGSFMKGTVLPFVAGAGSAMSDPIGFGIGAFTGWGLGKVGAKIAAGAAGKAALTGIEKAATAKVGLEGAKKFAMDVFDNSIGNSISEALVWKDREESFEKYTAADFLKNAIGGSVLMTGAIHGAAKSLKTVAKLGDKSLDSFQRMTDTVLEQEISPSVMESHIRIMDSVIDHTAESKGIVESSFEGKVELGDDMADSMANIKQAHSEGKISNEELKSFNEKIQESTVDNRVLDLDKDNAFKFTDEEIVKFNEDMANPKNSIHHDEVASQASDTMEGYDPSIREDEISQEMDDLFSSIEQVDEIDTDLAPTRQELDPELKAIKDEMDNDTRIMEAQDEYLKCRLS